RAPDDPLAERVALAHRLLRPPALHELADLAADRLGHLQELGVGLLDLAAEELDDAEHLAGEPDREAEGAVQSLPVCRGRARKVGVLRDVADPGGFAGGPDAPRESLPPRQRDAPRHRLELGHASRGAVPDLDAAERLPRPVDRPDRARLPSERLGDGLEEAWSRVAERRRLGPDAPRRMLHD